MMTWDDFFNGQKSGTKRLFYRDLLEIADAYGCSDQEVMAEFQNYLERNGLKGTIYEITSERWVYLVIWGPKESLVSVAGPIEPAPQPPKVEVVREEGPWTGCLLAIFLALMSFVVLYFGLDALGLW